MKFRITVRHAGGASESWVEEYDRAEIDSLEEAQEWAEATIASFNDTLEVNEQPRELVGVEWLQEESDKHKWHKTNPVTIRAPGGGIYDTYECSECDITGKLWGLGPSIIRDREFKAMGYASCKQAKVLLARRAKMRAKKRGDR